MVRMAKIYEELEESERQVEAGQTMNAREHLASVREKYGVQSGSNTKGIAAC